MDDISFPIVGTLEGKTGNTFRSFITSVTNNISSTTLLTTEAIRQSIQSAIKSVFPSSREDVVDLATKLINNEPVIEFGWEFSDSINLASIPLDADFGIPGLGFYSQCNLEAYFY